MRLRRETGDFSIVFDTETNTYKSLKKGLSAEDLIGAIMLNGNQLSICELATTTNDEAIELKFSSGGGRPIYNPKTGEITTDGVG